MITKCALPWIWFYYWVTSYGFHIACGFTWVILFLLISSYKWQFLLVWLSFTMIWWFPHSLTNVFECEFLVVALFKSIKTNTSLEFSKCFIFLFLALYTAVLMSPWIWALSQDMSEQGRGEAAKISLLWLLQLCSGIGWRCSLHCRQAFWWSSEHRRDELHDLLCCKSRYRNPFVTTSVHVCWQC